MYPNSQDDEQQKQRSRRRENRKPGVGLRMPNPEEVQASLPSMTPAGGAEFRYVAFSTSSTRGTGARLETTAFFVLLK
jgi:hypothetical protein